jgi:hypothetical protein
LKRIFQLVLILFCLVSCGTGGINERSELLNFYKTGAYDLGLQFLETKEFFKSEKERLLYFLEKGMFLHSKGDFENSNQALEEAEKIANELFTISVSAKIQQSTLNDNYDKFYGEVYERSMIYYYRSINSLFLYFKTHERNDLFKARANILAWDSFLKSIKDDRAGKTVYKNDLLLKIYGAKVHELIGTREDEQIAINLYKEAEDIIFKNYNTYPSFNQKFKEFKKDYDKLPSMKTGDVVKNYIAETDHAIILKKYIKDSLERLKKKKTQKNIALTVLVEKDLIAEKYPSKTEFGLQGLSNEPLMRLFVADILGLMPTANNYNPGGAYAGIVTADAAMKLFAFSFEVPKVRNRGVLSTFKFILVDDKNAEVISKDLSLINPMGDIAEESIYESSAALYTRIGARLTTKHVAAILASFGTYKALGGGSNKESPFAKNAAILQYAAASRIIEQSEKADTRYWSTLPNEIRMTDIEVLPGAYTAYLDVGLTERINLGKVEISENQIERILHFRK